MNYNTKRQIVEHTFKLYSKDKVLSKEDRKYLKNEILKLSDEEFNEELRKLKNALKEKL